MTNTRDNDTENGTAVAEQGGELGPHKASSSKKIARSNKVAANSQKGAKGKVPTAKKKSKAANWPNLPLQKPAHRALKARTERSWN